MTLPNWFKSRSDFPIRQEFLQGLPGAPVTRAGRYDRILGHVYCGGRWVNREMIAEGWAWHYKEYSDSTVLARAQKEAQIKELGLWQDLAPRPPWQFRRKPAAPPTSTVVVPDTPQSTTTVENPTVYVTKTWDDYAMVGKQMVWVLGRNFRVDKTTPKDFARLRAAMSEGIAPTTLHNGLMWVRVMFNWALHSELIGPPRYGKSFNKPKHKNTSRFSFRFVAQIRE